LEKAMSAKTQPHLHLTKLVNASRNHLAAQVALCTLVATVVLFFLVPKMAPVETASSSSSLSMSLPTDPAAAMTGARWRLGLSSTSASSRLLSQSLLSSTASPQTEQEDLFISLKTSKQFHQSRLAVVIKTWFQLARDQIWFFSDAEDAYVYEKTNGHLRATNCTSSHSRQALCCKMAAEFDAFFESGKRWFCHFDDDNYVNVPALLRKLRQFDHREDWYLGKPSIPEPLEILDRDNMQRKIKFWFATGGAGFCLSRSLAVRMLPVAGGGRFESVGEKIRLPDDVTMGYISDHVLRTPLTVVKEFHSHLEPQRFLSAERDFDDQISFSYSKYGAEMNVIEVDGFSKEEDPTRFMSLHCKLFPHFSWCPRYKMRST